MSVGQRFGLGAIDQISFAVENLDEAVPRYTAMFGPFIVVEVPDMEVVCHGEPTTVTLKVAFGRSGSLEVELVEVVSGAWPTVRWLEEHGEGLHHVRYPVVDVESCVGEMEAAGFEVTMRGATAGVSFAYVESPLLHGMTVELVKGV